MENDPPNFSSSAGAIRILGALPVSHHSNACRSHTLCCAESEEEGSDVERRPVRAQNKKLKSEVGRHKAELDSLKERDPEFFKYLQETDAELLEFGDDGADDGGDSGDDSDEPEAAAADEADEVCAYLCVTMVGGRDPPIELKDVQWWLAVMKQYPRY